MNSNVLEPLKHLQENIQILDIALSDNGVPIENKMIGTRFSFQNIHKPKNDEKFLEYRRRKYESKG